MKEGMAQGVTSIMIPASLRRESSGTTLLSHYRSMSVAVEANFGRGCERPRSRAERETGSVAVNLRQQC
jgi:hypothetical protein